MNEDLKTILQVVGGLAFVVAMPIFAYLVNRKMQKQHANLPNMSPEQLRALAAKQPFLHCNKVISELKSRGEEITFALPLLFDLAVQKNAAARLVGWTGLKQHFADMLPNLDFSKNKPTPAERDWMQSKLGPQGQPLSY